MIDGTTMLAAVLDHVEKHGSVTNRECRELVGISYDQAIKVLGALAKGGVLRRTGTASGTRYLRGSKKIPQKRLREMLIDIERLLKRAVRKSQP